MFDDFMRNGKVRKCTPDRALAKALIGMSSSQLIFISSISVTAKNASSVLVNYYEALREICEAICAKDGYKVYSHEAFTFYLKEKLGEEVVAQKFDRLRRLRNGINYYGEAVSLAEAKDATKEVKMLIDLLKRKYLQIKSSL